MEDSPVDNAAGSACDGESPCGLPLATAVRHPVRGTDPAEASKISVYSMGRTCPRTISGQHPSSAWGAPVIGPRSDSRSTETECSFSSGRLAEKERPLLVGRRGREREGERSSQCRSKKESNGQKDKVVSQTDFGMFWSRRSVGTGHVM
jgi:hypothetical protein